MSERRHEERRSAEGEVTLWLDEPAGEITGRLIDMSGSGFRAAHPAITLRSGQIVRFQHGPRQGTARTIWTRIVGGFVESGFRIV
jgi:hypothetical protein